MAYTQAQGKATRKYNEANYERVNLSVLKGTKTAWKTAADANNQSLNSFVIEAVEEKIKRSEEEKNGCIDR